jgi:hypothetical protein
VIGKSSVRTLSKIKRTVKNISYTSKQNQSVLQLLHIQLPCAVISLLATIQGKKTFLVLTKDDLNFKKMKSETGHILKLVKGQ